VEKLRKVTDFTYSLGLTVGKDGNLTAVAWEGPAFKAGLTAGVQLVAVNGTAYDADDLKEVLKSAASPGTPPIELLVKNGDRYRTVPIDYHGGSRYPHLERIADTPSRLDDILAARK